MYKAKYESRIFFNVDENVAGEKKVCHLLNPLKEEILSSSTLVHCLVGGGDIINTHSSHHENKHIYETEEKKNE